MTKVLVARLKKQVWDKMNKLCLFRLRIKKNPVEHFKKRTISHLTSIEPSLQSKAARSPVFAQWIPYLCEWPLRADAG